MGAKELLWALALAAALSGDSFAAGLGLGAQGIRVPLASALLVAGLGTGCLAAGIGLGRLAGPALPAAAAKTAGALLLLALGAFKAGESGLKLALRRRGGRGSVRFALGGLRFLLDVYASPARADRDRSKRLSAGEALGLGAGLSADGLAAGLSLGLGGRAALPLLAATLALGAVLLKAGAAAARWAAGRLPFDLSPLAGAILMALALTRLR